MWSRDALEQVLADIARARHRPHPHRRAQHRHDAHDGGPGQLYADEAGGGRADRRGGVRGSRHRHGRVRLLGQAHRSVAAKITVVAATKIARSRYRASSRAASPGSARPRRPSSSSWAQRHRRLAAGLGHRQSRLFLSMPASNRSSVAPSTGVRRTARARRTACEFPASFDSRHAASAGTSAADGSIPSPQKSDSDLHRRCASRPNDRARQFGAEQETISAALPTGLSDLATSLPCFHGDDLDCGFRDGCRRQDGASMNDVAYAFSAIMMTGALMLPPTRSGITDASTTRSRSTPRTRNSASTTAVSSRSGPCGRCRAGGAR